MEEEGEVEETAVLEVTAVQVLNRFHEVYSRDTLFSADRVQSISELFSDSASICSLKSGAQFLTGRTAIAESFAKTSPAAVAVSKRVFVESSPSATTSLPRASFVFDLHRKGTSPGLGDKTKDGVLLYRVVGASIEQIWGAVDNERLAVDENLTEERLFQSKVWKLAGEIMQREVQPIGERHYHNYDHMEVWG